MPVQHLNEKDESAAHMSTPDTMHVSTTPILSVSRHSHSGALEKSSEFFNNHLINFELIFVMLHPPMMPVTTRIIVFGDPYLLHPSFAIGLLATQLESEEIIIHEHHPEHIRQYLSVQEASLELFPSSLGWTSPFLIYMKRHICNNFFPGWTTAVFFVQAPFWWVYALQRHVIWMLVHVWHNGGCPDGRRRVTLGCAKGGCFEPWWKQNVFAKHLRLGGLLRLG